MGRRHNGGGRRLRSIRAALRALEPRGVTERIPDPVRRRVLEYVEAGRRDGQSWADLGEALGLSPTTLKRWRADGDLGADAPALLPVTIADGVEAGAPGRRFDEAKLVAVSRGGLRVEGLDLGQAIELMRALG